MKRIFSFVITAVLLIQCIVFAESPTITNINLAFEESGIVVTADAGTAGIGCAMTVVRDGGSAKNPQDVFAVRESVSGEDNKVSFTFKMPEQRDGEKTDGSYVIYIKGSGTDRVSYHFDYVGKEGQNNAIDLLLGAQSVDELMGYLDSGSELRAALESSGLVFESYDLFSEKEKEETARLMKDNMKKESLREDFNLASALSKINLSDDIGQWISQTGAEFENISYDDSTAKSFIDKIIMENRAYDTFSQYYHAYETANILYLINNSKYNEIYDILYKYQNTLGIESDSAVKEYLSMTGNKRQAVSEKLITSFARSNALSTADVIKAVSDSIKAVENDSVSSGNTSSSDNGAGAITIGKTPVSETENIPVNTETSGFTDLVSVPWAEGAIMELYRKGIVSGVGNGLFEPKSIVTREAFVKMLVEALGKNDKTAKTDYSDVEPGAWYECYVASAANNGIVSGIGENLFGIGMEITRQDAAVMIANCIDLESAEDDFVFSDDADISDYAKEAVYKLYSAGIISGMDDKSFMPKGSCTRAQAAVIIYNMINYISDNQEDDEIPDKTSAYSEQINMLSAFGFLNGISADSFDENNFMVRQRFIISVVAMAQPEKLSDTQALEYARTTGLINTDGYDLNGNITFNEAVDILVSLLGYKNFYKDRDAISIASEIGLLKNTTRTQSGPADAGTLIQLLYNALEIPLITVESATINGVKAEIDKDNTILSVYHNIYETEGVITQNEDTALTGDSSVGENGIELDGVFYSAGSSNAKDFLGMRVKAFVRRSGTEDNEIIYLEQYRNNVTEIEAELIEEASFSKITYYMSEDDNGAKTVRISPVVKVIYNQKAYPEYTDEDLNIESGFLRLIDNDGDGNADVVFINEYDFIVVDSVSSVNETIYNIYQNPQSLKIEEDDKISAYLNGEEVKYTDFEKNQILAVMSSKNSGKRIIRIEASDKTVNGTVTGIDYGNGEITIDNAAYDLSLGYLNAQNAGDVKLPEIKLGTQYTFYLDVFGDIVYLDRSESSGLEYAYARKFEYDDGNIEGTLALRYMDVNGVWTSAGLAENVRISGVNGTKKREEVFDILTDNGVFEEQLLRIKKNSNGEINTIETAEERAYYIDDNFNKRTVSGDLQWGVNNFSFDSQIFCFEDTYVFRVPVNADGNENDYAVTGRSLFVADGRYTFTAYDLDEFNYAKVIVVKQSSDIKSGTTPFVVAKIEYREVNGEVLPAITGILGENTEYTVFGEKEDTFAGVSKGDVIQIGVNTNGTASGYNMLYSVEESYGKKINPDKINSAAADVAGFITEIDRTGDRIKIDNGMTGGLTILKDSAARIALYDMEKNTVEEVSIADLEKGDYLYARLGWSKVKVILVIRNGN